MLLLDLPQEVLHIIVWQCGLGDFENFMLTCKTIYNMGNEFIEERAFQKLWLRDSKLSGSYDRAASDTFNINCSVDFLARIHRALPRSSLNAMRYSEELVIDNSKQAWICTEGWCSSCSGDIVLRFRLDGRCSMKRFPELISKLCNHHNHELRSVSLHHKLQAKQAAATVLIMLELPALRNLLLVSHSWILYYLMDTLTNLILSHGPNRLFPNLRSLTIGTRRKEITLYHGVSLQQTALLCLLPTLRELSIRNLRGYSFGSETEVDTPESDSGIGQWYLIPYDGVGGQSFAPLTKLTLRTASADGRYLQAFLGEHKHLTSFTWEDAYTMYTKAFNSAPSYRTVKGMFQSGWPSQHPHLEIEGDLTRARLDELDALYRSTTESQDRTDDSQDILSSAEIEFEKGLVHFRTFNAHRLAKVLASTVGHCLQHLSLLISHDRSALSMPTRHQIEHLHDFPRLIQLAIDLSFIREPIDRENRRRVKPSLAKIIPPMIQQLHVETSDDPSPQWETDVLGGFLLPDAGFLNLKQIRVCGSHDRAQRLQYKNSNLQSEELREGFLRLNVSCRIVYQDRNPELPFD